MGTRATDQPGIDLKRYGDVVISRWPVVVAGGLVGLLLAGAYLFITPTSYTSTTSLTVFPITSDPYASNRNSSNLLDMEAEVATASSFRVADLAAEATNGLWDSVDLRRSAAVTTGGDGSTMNISVTADGEQRARAGASALADSYIKARSEQASSSIDQVVQRDQARIVALREELTASIGRLASEPAGSPAAAEASADQQITNLQLSALLSRISALEGVDTTGGAILNPASKTAIVTEPSRVTVLATGLVAGLGLGIIAAFVVQSRRRVIHGPRDFTREFGVAVIGGWRSSEEEASALATAAERVIRVAAVHDSTSVLLIADRAVANADQIGTGLLEAVRRSGADSDAPTQARRSDRALLRIETVSSAMDEAERLHALRTNDIALVVAAAGATHIRDVTDILDDAAQMGCRVVGALIVPGDKPRSGTSSTGGDAGAKTAERDENVGLAPVPAGDVH